MTNDIVGMLLIGFLVNVAASLFILSIQERLEEWKSTKPYLFHLLTPLTFCLVIGIIFLSNKFSTAYVSLQPTEIRIPLPFFTNQYFEFSSSRLSLWSALSISFFGFLTSAFALANAFVSQHSQLGTKLMGEYGHRLIRYEYLKKPVDAAWLVGAMFAGYKLSLTHTKPTAYALYTLLLLIVMSGILILVIGSRACDLERPEKLPTRVMIILALMNAFVWSIVTLIIWL